MTDPRTRILHTLATSGDLDAVLSGFDLERLLRAFDGPFARDRRAELAALLCLDRAHDLSPRVLAEVVHALRSVRNRATFSGAIRGVFDGLTGEDFRDFKYLLNATGDRHDLEHLVFERLTHIDRHHVLRRIREEAAARSHHELRILSDIDDTVKSMLHDRRFARGRVYPGVVQFLRELDDGAAAEPGRPGDLTFVTARPEGPRGLIEQYTRDALAPLGLPPHTVLGGAFLNIATKASIAARKLQNFEHERMLFPECRYVFVGDSGQADPQVGAAMVARAPDFVARVLIHDVTGVDAQRRARWARRGVSTFETYSGAARIAHGLGLVSEEGVARVHAAVLEGLDTDAVRPGHRDALVATAEREVQAG
ncbi:phosphatase domain-containing protein [Agrococcus sp. SGAir0287]|uniref:phosphatase domain-containing protein n=1 Tax=Agrococcus sp. SGAir0287 TaxID=2070347 RepID=UPI0015863657|nr:phosphatase domain-containing protein [Agrococcus sp. SGAir0287]